MLIQVWKFIMFIKSGPNLSGLFFFYWVFKIMQK